MKGKDARWKKGKETQPHEGILTDALSVSLVPSTSLPLPQITQVKEERSQVICSKVREKSEPRGLLATPGAFWSEWTKLGHFG